MREVEQTKIESTTAIQPRSVKQLDSAFAVCSHPPMDHSFKVVEAAPSGDRIIATADNLAVARAAFDRAAPVHERYRPRRPRVALHHKVPQDGSPTAGSAEWGDVKVRGACAGKKSDCPPC
jgi:hypothetical protein